MAEKFIDRVVNLSGLEKQELNKFYKAVLKAVQYDCFQHDQKGFHLLEGTVRVTPKGNYIFTPSEHMKTLLDGADYPSLLKLEENRFLELIKLALTEVD